MNYNIHETFQGTVQGEGFHAGRPCDFIRLYGCPVGCYFCDTGYADESTETIIKYKKSEDTLIDELKSDFVVISGGEPFIHKNLGRLCLALMEKGKEVAIETSGSFTQQVPSQVWITLSPKEHIANKYPVLPEMWDMADEVKIVISNGKELSYYRDNLSKFNGLKYLQPEYDDLENTTKMTLLLLKHNQEFKLSLQTHKMIGVE